MRKTMFVFVSLLCLLALPALAQLDTATISGRVTDSSGAVVAGAQITVVDVDTNFTSDTKTNVEGFYRVPSLRPGPYRLTAASARLHLSECWPPRSEKLSLSNSGIGR